MGFTTTKAYKDLYHALFHEQGESFEKLCEKILCYTNPWLVQAARLKDFDRAGFDLYVPNKETQEPEVFFQMKSSQAPFSDSRIQSCLDSIRKFKNSKYSGQIFYLVLNKPITNEEHRKLLENSLKDLEQSGKVHCAVLFDLHVLMSYIQQWVSSSINAMAENRANDYLDDFKTSLEQNFYCENIPYTLKRGDVFSNDENPSNYILERIRPIHEVGRMEKGKYLFVISEFGFGKTSLIFEIFTRLKTDRNHTLIYLPAPLLSKETFDNEGSVAKDILKIISPEEVGKGVFEKFIRGTLQNMMKNDNTIIVLVDGLDEHKAFHSQKSLQAMFNSLIDFKAVFIFSLRKEMWDNRYLDIENSISKKREIQDRLFLNDWNDSNIIEFINKYRDNITEEDDISELNIMLNHVKAGNYYKIYGDIPKRPLFLKMLIADLKNLNSKNITITQLYQNYFIRKIARDISGTIYDVIIDRGLLGSILDVAQKTYRILEDVSLNMIVESNNSIVCENSIESTIVEKVGANYGINDLLQLKLHSVLVGSETRKNFSYNLRFAHFSFLEFFVASKISNEIVRDGKESIWLEKKYPETLGKFINEHLKTKTHEVYPITFSQ